MGMRKGEGKCTRRGRRWGEKRDDKGGRKGEKRGKIMQLCAIFCNQNNAKWRDPTNSGWEPGLKAH